MRGLSLFSGLGGYDLGCQIAGVKVVGQVEIEDAPQRVLQHHFPDVPKWRDICDVTAEDIRATCGRVDIIFGGSPCNDISKAGRGTGINGEKSRLWWEMYRLIKDLRPRWILLENSAAIRTRGADEMLFSLERIGYACWILVLKASDIGAPHQRERAWIVGYAYRKPKRESQQEDNSDPDYRQTREVSGISGAELVHSDIRRSQGSWSGREKTPGDREATGVSSTTSSASIDVSDSDSLQLWQQSRWWSWTSRQSAQVTRWIRERFGTVADANSDIESAGTLERGNCLVEAEPGSAQPGSDSSDVREVSASTSGADGVGQADSIFKGLERHRIVEGSIIQKFPEPPGYYQQIWEEPRLTDSKVVT